MFLYRIYQIFIMLPILAAATILCAIVTILGCALGGEKWDSARHPCGVAYGACLPE